MFTISSDYLVVTTLVTPIKNETTFVRVFSIYCGWGGWCNVKDVKAICIFNGRRLTFYLEERAA